MGPETIRSTLRESIESLTSEFVNQPDSKSIFKALRTVRRSMMLSNFFHWSARWTLAFLFALVAVFAWKWARGTLGVSVEVLPALALWVLVPPFAGGVLCGGFMALALPPSRRDAARTADRLWKTRDRFVTALDFLARKQMSQIEGLALAECAEFAAKNKGEVPVLPPAELRWAVIPLMMIALISWDSLGHESARQALVEKAKSETSGTIQQLESLAAQLDKTSKLAEHLRQSAEQLRAEAKAGRDGEKARLRELSMLEQLVKEMRQQHAATPDELKALADALAASEQTKDAAAAMRRGDFAEAAKKLEEAAKNPEAAAQAEQNLKSALEHLAQKKEQLSKQLEQLRDNARESGGSGERQQLMQQLAQALSELQKDGKLGAGKDGKDGGKNQQQKGQQGGKEMTDDDLKRMLSALQNLKNNEGPPGGDGEPQPDENGGDGEVRMSNFSGNKPGGSTPGTDENGEQAPTGKAGDKDETGTTKDPFGQQVAAAKGGKEEQSSARLGEGESLSAMIPSAPGADEKAKRRYRELYRAAASDAEDAVVQESIPLGARFLIKRYFESIRPR